MRILAYTLFNADWAGVCYLPNHLNYSNPDTRNKRGWTFRNECPALFYVIKFGGFMSKSLVVSEK